MKITEQEHFQLNSWIEWSGVIAGIAIIFIFVGFGLTASGNLIFGLFFSSLTIPLLLLSIIIILYAISQTLLLQFEIIKSTNQNQQDQQYECIACGAVLGKNRKSCPECGRQIISERKDNKN